VLGYVTSVRRLEGVETVLHALGEFAREGHRVVFVLVGDGPELAALRTVAGDLCKDKKVAFLGNRDDVPSLMNAMDVYCLTSLREGLSNTLLEAHACGLPVIATDTGGNGEVVVTGRTGFLFKVGDDAALTILMRNLAEHQPLRNSLSVAARERAAKKFSIARMVREYEKLYENVLH
jgi:glycosyltransferase involved in cell wall biosynthesis